MEDSKNLILLFKIHTGTQKNFFEIFLDHLGTRLPKRSPALTYNVMSVFFFNLNRIIQVNQPTKCNNFSSLLLDVYLQLNMFQASSRPSSGAQQMQ